MVKCKKHGQEEVTLTYKVNEEYIDDTFCIRCRMSSDKLLIFKDKAWRYIHKKRLEQYLEYGVVS